MLGLSSMLRLFHSVVIVYLSFSLYEINKTVPASYVGIQILITLLFTLFQGDSFKRDWKQIFLSLSLVYALRPTELNFIRYLFLGKIFYLQRSLAQVSQNIFDGSHKIFRLLKVTDLEFLGVDLRLSSKGRNPSENQIHLPRIQNKAVHLIEKLTILAIYNYILKVIRSSIRTQSPFLNIQTCIFDFARLACIFYMVFGVFIIVYKYWAYLWTDPEKTLSTHQILYFFMVTSSSIGYGDITPKNKYQMYFLIAFIPILVIIFGQFFGQALGYFDEFISILRQNSTSLPKTNILSQGIWGKQNCTNLISYISQAQSKNSQIYQQNQVLVNNWISIACKNYDSYQPLLMQILDQQDSKQYRLLVASRLKHQFYPQNWTIIQKGNIDKHIFMIEQGKVQVEGQVLTAGKTFNLSGFTKQQASASTYVTKTFTSVWAISVADLIQIGRSSVNLQNKINRKLKQIQTEI